MLFDTLEQKTLRNSRKLKEMSLLVEKLDRDVEQLFKERNIDPLQVTQFLAEKENFSESEWVEIQEANRALNKELEVALQNIRDPRKAQKAQSDRHVQPHWLYVR